MWGRSNWRILVVLKKKGINFSRIKERENLPKVLDISGGRVGGGVSEGHEILFYFLGLDGSNRLSGSF